MPPSVPPSEDIMSAQQERPVSLHDFQDQETNLYMKSMCVMV